MSDALRPTSTPAAQISRTDPRTSRGDRSFVFLLAPLALVSLPSLLFCALAFLLRLHGAPGAQVEFHFPPQNTWDRLFALELSANEFVARWNSACTLAATGLFVTTMLLPRWRHYLTLAVIPWGLLLCADFTLRWR